MQYDKPQLQSALLGSLTGGSKAGGNVGKITTVSNRPTSQRGTTAAAAAVGGKTARDLLVPAPAATPAHVAGQDASNRLRACSIDSEKENQCVPGSGGTVGQQVRSLKDACAQSLPDIQMQVEINQKSISVKMSSHDAIAESTTPVTTPPSAETSQSLQELSSVPEKVVTSQASDADEVVVDDEDDVIKLQVLIQRLITQTVSSK